MKKFSLVLFLLLLLLMLVACRTDDGIIDGPDTPKVYEVDEEGFFILEDDYFKNTSKADGKMKSKLRYSDNIDTAMEYNQMRLYAQDKEIPIYNTKVNVSQNWNALAPQRANNGVAIIELEGVMTFKLQTNFLIRNECKISPQNRNVSSVIDEDRRVVTFTITEPGQYTIEFRSYRTLHLFVNGYKQYDEYKTSGNLIYFGPGIHNSSNSPYIKSDNYIRLNSNQTVLVDLGAVLECGFKASNATNFKIVGSGIISGAKYERNGTTGARLIPYDFSYCTNFKIEGISTLDPAGWCYNIYFCQNVFMDNIKIISSRSNGDGVSLQSSQDVICQNAFVRSWDDSLVVKNYPNPSKTGQGVTRNILFYNCILWTDLAQSMEIGFETIGTVMENIVFDNIIVIHNFHKPPISIHNGNNANIKNVEFKNITIEDAAMGKGDGIPVLIEITTEFSTTWSTNHMTTELGSIDGVLVKNVLVLKGITTPKISLRGSIDRRSGYNNSLHEVMNVIFEDIYLYDMFIDEEYSNLQMVYTKDIIFRKTVDIVTGATFIKTQNASLYGTENSIETV